MAKRTTFFKTVNTGLVASCSFCLKSAGPKDADFVCSKVCEALAKEQVSKKIADLLLSR